MISANHAASVRANVDSAVEQGARALPEDARSPANGGFFVAPTVLTGVEHGAPAAREEIFGPVATFLPWDDEEEALDRVNDSRYALSASVWTRDIDQGLALVQDVEAGYVWLNTAGEFPWATPFGGWKDSGLGQQECLEELRSYQQCKTVHVRLRA
jgi:betaine-aldehyde dehydrogenase